MEVLVVESSGMAAAAELQREQPWVRVIGRPERLLPGAARNLGARAARGSRLGFLDADAVPGPGWIAALEAAIDRDGCAAAAGAVHNGTPQSAVGTAAYLLEFSEWNPERRGAPLHGATCNLLVERSAFESAGGFCEDLWPGEDTLLTMPWGQAHRLDFAVGAGVWHLNRTGLGDFLAHQHRLGQAFALICDRVDFPHRRFSHWPLLAAAPALRAGAITRRLSRSPEQLAAAARVTHLLALGLTAWTAGVASQR
jgi:glycosyltransferase involved in cell wall biosynthesis